MRAPLARWPSGLEACLRVPVNAHNVCPHSELCANRCLRLEIHHQTVFMNPYAVVRRLAEKPGVYCLQDVTHEGEKMKKSKIQMTYTFWRSFACLCVCLCSGSGPRKLTAASGPSCAPKLVFQAASSAGARPEGCCAGRTRRLGATKTLVNH
jgi:hypothetical protein